VESMCQLYHTPISASRTYFEYTTSKYTHSTQFTHWLNAITVKMLHVENETHNEELLFKQSLYLTIIVFIYRQTKELSRYICTSSLLCVHRTTQRHAPPTHLITCSSHSPHHTLLPLTSSHAPPTHLIIPLCSAYHWTTRSSHWVLDIACWSVTLNNNNNNTHTVNVNENAVNI